MTNECATTFQIPHDLWPGQVTGNWKGDYQGSRQPSSNLLNLLMVFRNLSLWKITVSTAQTSEDVWEPDSPADVRTVPAARKALLISELGWSQDETMETLMRLRNFKSDWDAPGMEVYDEL